MPGSTFGKLFKVTTYGESHGSTLGCIIDGCPAGFYISTSEINRELIRRAPGRSHFTSQRQEKDLVSIESGVFEGKTLGTPIMLQIRNTDARPKDYGNLTNIHRPGHGDYTYLNKYGHRDHRGGGRASARETVARVAAGAIAKKYLKEQYGIEFIGYLKSIGEISAQQLDFKSKETNPFFFPDPSKITDIEHYLKMLRKNHDSCGGQVGLIIKNAPCGLGEPCFDKLDALLAYAMMGIPAAKGVEIGAGFASANTLGSIYKDEITPTGFSSNNSGGVLAGISTGQDITVNIAFKPTSSIPKECNSIDINNNSVKIKVGGRHDPCVAIRAVPIVESMAALVLMDLSLINNNSKIKK